jgi:hypothetical protein
LGDAVPLHVREKAKIAFVFCHATAVLKSQMSVFPPNPRLAKLCIEPIELIDDVDRRTVWESAGNGSGHVFPRQLRIGTHNPRKPQSRPSFPYFLQFLAVVLVSVLVLMVIQSNFRRRDQAD